MSIPASRVDAMGTNPAQQRMQLGHAARKAGRVAEALDHYRGAVEQEPQSAEANTVYGLMLLQLGRAGEAESPLRKAVEIEPRHVALRMNLARWLAQEGQIDEAVEVVSSVIADEPQHAWAWERLGELNAKQRRFGEAARHFRRATELQPQDPSILFKLARASFDDGRGDEAERILDEASALAPGNGAILRLYAEIHESRGEWEKLRKSAQDWVAAQPREPAAWRALAMSLWESGYLMQAKENFRHALKLGEREARHLTTYARLCMSALDYETAGKALEEAEALDPDLGYLHSAKAMCLMVTGRHDEAAAYARRALAGAPADPFSYRTLALATGGGLSPSETAALEKLADRKDLLPVHRATAAFALGECREAQGDFEAAFAEYERANAFAREQSRAEGIAYDPAARERQVADLMRIFPSVPGVLAGEGRPWPVFIVGMPRSGTTLVESVIGAHSRAHACGERLQMRWIMTAFLKRVEAGKEADIDADGWAQWRELYLQGLPEGLAADAFTDKNPWNFDAIGLIAKLFPAARVVHIRRNPVETGFSIYRNQFGKTLPYTSRLEDIGHYYGQYARLMAHWARAAAGRFTTIQYEDFVRDFESAGPALLAACGLDWERACARFWESSRAIGTMSLMQARRPLEARAGRAGRYGARLAPLVAALEKAGVDTETGALRGVS
jgi:tetratricopeptide (TPR) repeat protein